MEAIAIISAVVSASAQIEQAEQQASAMRLQAQQAELQGRQNALNYNRQANEIFMRQQRLGSTVRARAAAGGVDPFTGSPLTVDQMNAQKAGREFQISVENAEMAKAGGLAQSQALYAAANSTEQIGMMKAIASAGMSYAMMGQTSVPGIPGGAPVVDMSTYPTNQVGF
jgi:hypothetical protein